MKSPRCNLQRVLIIITIFTIPAFANSAVISLGTFDSHQYYYDTSAFTSIFDARSAALTNGYELVSITSSTENDFLINEITNDVGINNALRTAWIGLSFDSSSSNWIWDSGELFSYSNWRPAGTCVGFAEPTGEDAGVMYVNQPGCNATGLWADTFSSGTEAFNAIYETSATGGTQGSVPEPSILTLMGLGLAGIIGSRRKRKTA